jgi:hypothetical protein
MTHPDTQNLINLVEEVTGYRATIDVIDGINESARMVSARPGSPAHLISVNSKQVRYADYIVAIQCGMLLVLWSDPSRVPNMVSESAKCDYWGKRWAQSKQLRSLPQGGAMKMAGFYLQGLIHQLQSMPLEIRVTRFCFETCPGLRDMQYEMVTANLRQLSEVFSPQIRAQAPAEVFDRNVAMNAALAKAWGDLIESKLPMIPYEATGFLERAEKLVAAVDALPEATSESHLKSVDSWAEQLGMSSLFRWESSNRIL